MAYSDDLRQRVLDLYDEGLKTRRIAKQLRVSPAWARRVKQFRDQPRKQFRGRAKVITGEFETKLKGWIQEQPDITLMELQQRFKQEFKLSVSIGCLFNTLRRLKLSFKKSR